MVCKHCKFGPKGTFHWTQNSGNFGWFIKWNRLFWFGLTGIFGTSFDGGPVWLVWSFWLVRPKSPFPFDKIVVPSTALLYPAYENNNQTHSGLGQVCATGMYCSIGHVKFPKFQTRFFVEWKAPKFPIPMSIQDQLSFLGNWAPTPPLTQSFSLRNE